MARIRTTGIVVSELEHKMASPKEDEPDSIKFQVVDVGGQRNERKKWIHCFDDVKAILFIVNLAGYNQVLFEDTTKNRMHEALELFHEISHRQQFLETPMFLFLNKKDLFEVMVNQTDLKVAFPEYDGGKNLANALKFVKTKFGKEMPKSKPPTDIQVVTGVWKRDIKCAFEQVKDALLLQNKKLVEQEKARIKKEEAAINKRKSGGGMCGGK
jgi:GTPase SAR1 family protein